MAMSVYSQDVVFETDLTFKEVLEKAKKEDKSVFIDFYTDWCGPCKKLNSTTFKDPQVGALLNSQFINHKVNAEKGEGVELAKKYEISGYPTMFFLDSDGRPIKRIVGYRDPNRLLEEVQSMTKSIKYGGYEQMISDFKAGTRNDQQFLTNLYNLLPKDDKLKPEVANRCLLHFPKEFIKSEVEADISFNDKLISNLKDFDTKTFYRLLDIFKEKLAEEGKFSGNYNLGVLFTVNLKLDEYMKNAINNGNSDFLETCIKYQQDYVNILQKGKPDGDVYIMSGRRLFFASPEFIRLRYLSVNKNDPEKFKKEIVPFIENLMTQYPLAEVQKKNGVRNGEEFGDKWINWYEYQRRSDMSVEYIIDWANYYWRISPSDKKTKALVAKWVNFACAINPYIAKYSKSSAPLLIKIGHSKDAIKNLEVTLKCYPKNNETVKRYIVGVQDMIDDIKNNKI